MLLQPHNHKYLSLKTTNPFTQLLTASKNYFQPLAVLQNLEPAEAENPIHAPNNNRQIQNPRYGRLFSTQFE